MDAKLFASMLADKSLFDLKKLQYKYSSENVSEMLALMKQSMYVSLPILDFNGQPILYLGSVAQVKMNAVKLLLTPRAGSKPYGISAMEEEIHSTLKIESIDSSRDSIRKILSGLAPVGESENRMLGMKRGLEFICDQDHPITEENLHALYQLTVGDYLTGDDAVLPGAYYRHDKVFVVGDKVECEGLSPEKLPEYMASLISFINTNTDMNDLIKAALIHFYVAYIHPYFDGNGRTARFLQLWYLVRQGYTSAMFVPLSSYIRESRESYYKAFRLIEGNQKLSGVVDATPFLAYFTENVYNKLDTGVPHQDTLSAFSKALAEGKITEKEKALWSFVLSAYGMNEFSTKQLERDFDAAAYATIRGFAVKFEELGLLYKQVYSNRPKYRVAE